ncbi:hypothetical protein GHK24_03470 [Rhodocyclus tenuis]|uniref:Uncharacterized protein n=2 Tax=Rhodocyclus TaxID=1064 RepID=A0A6L5JWB6_RHOTE|nr:hypothetical protein [Rhodocyclus gracilis]
MFARSELSDERIREKIIKALEEPAPTNTTPPPAARSAAPAEVPPAPPPRAPEKTRNAFDIY